MAQLSPEGAFDTLKDRVAGAVQSYFPFEGKKNSLVAHKVWVDDDKDVDDLRSQKASKLSNRSWTVPVRADVSLVNKETGKVINRSTIQVANIPKITRRYSYIIDGNEWQVDNQLRLKSGVYHRKTLSGELESHWNAVKGMGFRVKFDPEKRKYKMEYGKAKNIALYPVLKAMGVADDDIERAWGKEVFQANQGVKDQEALSRFYKTVTGEQPESAEQARDLIRETFAATELLEDTTKVTLGKAESAVTGRGLLTSATKLLNISRGKVAEDDRESLKFKELHSVEDFLGKRVMDSSKDITRKLRNNIDRKRSVREVLTPDIFNRPVKGFFVGSGLSQRPEQHNPLEFISGHTRTTLLGEGGISDINRVVEDAKLINPSSLGFLDPVQTPESAKVGINLQLTLGAEKDGNRVTARVWNVKKAKFEQVDAATLQDSVVAYPDQVRWKGGKPVFHDKRVKVSDVGGGISTSSTGKVQYVLPSSKSLFGMTANTIPFFSSLSGVRAGMATRQVEQAIPLVHREAPLVQVKTESSKTFEDVLGQFNSHQSPVDGTVAQVKKDAVIVEDAAGTKHEVQMYHDFPLNTSSSVLNSTALVKAGDKVARGQTVADSNFTRGGQMALGTNLRVGYLPYFGYNFEDGIVLSETAATKLTSEHMHRQSLAADKDVVQDKKKFLANLPTGELTPHQREILDDDGVVQEGTTVEMGDVLVGALRKRELNKEEKTLRLLSKAIVSPYQNSSVRWEKEHPGKVVRVVKGPKRTTVYVKTEEPAKVGDKMVGRHANKGIITLIVPDHEMPHTKDGNPIEVALNPNGIPTRMNPSQVLETAASKVAEKTGTRYVVNNFDPTVENYTAKVQQDLKDAGVVDKEPMYDPETGKLLGDILVGKQYMYKLHHQVDKKLSARAGGVGSPYDVNQIPKSGGDKGAKSLGSLGLYAMLAHGSRDNLREMMTYKGSRNDELWTALQAGEPLPPPQPTFAMEKLKGYMKVMGVNVEKKGNSLNLIPLTDKDVKAMAPKQLPDAAKMVRGKDLRPEIGGLFDPFLTGGVSGTKWTHMKLVEPVPNPIFEKAILSLTGLKRKEFDDIMDAETVVDGKTGGRAIQGLLGAINVDQELKLTEERLGKLRGSNLDRANRRVKYLRALQSNKMSPTEAYMTSVVPILPPAMRPISQLDNGEINYDDINGLYKNLSLVNQRLREIDPDLPESDKKELRKDLYDSIQALAITGTTIRGKEHKGIMGLITGDQPKQGFFQKKITARQQDMTIRSTIVPEPSLGLDEVGLPAKAAMQLYRPFVVQYMFKQMGYKPLDAQAAVKANHPAASHALEQVIKDRPIMMKRDPVLHKFGIMAFQPKLVNGKAIRIHPLVTGGFNADFDGDQQVGSVVVSVSPSAYNADRPFWGPRRCSMAARFLETLPTVDRDGVFAVCSLEDFPHGERIGEKGHIEFYRAAPGLQVVAADETTGEARLSSVAGWSVHHDREVEIVTLGSGRQIVTDDDERAVYGVDASSLEWCRRRPAEAMDQFVPVLDDSPFLDTLDELECGVHDEAAGRVALDASAGYFFGSMVGDGWVVHSSGACKAFAFSSSFEDVQVAWEGSLDSMYEKRPHISHNFGKDDRFPGSQGSWRSTVTDAAMARWLEPLLGCGAGNKHLPPFYLSAPHEFLCGMLAGLIDTDGSMSRSNAKKKPQFLCSYSSTSLRLVQELQYMLRHLGVSSGITATKTPKGAPAWMLSISSVGLYELGALPICHQGKREVFEEFLAGPPPDKSMAYSKYRLVPLPASLAKDLRKKVDRASHWSLYVTLSKAVERQYISKETARKILYLGITSAHPLFGKWSALVRSDGMHFERVKRYDKTGQTETGYDLTVPGPETFMAVDGVVLSNTMVGFVPIAKDAVEEARKMYPSRNLFNDATGRVMYVPGQESVMGLYELTAMGKPSGKSFKNEKAVLEALRKGEVETTNKVTINGRVTTPGRVRVAATLPDNMPTRDKVLYDSGFQLKKGNLSQVIEDAARNSEGSFGQVADGLKDLGNRYAFDAGMTIGLSDVAPYKEDKDAILGATERKLSKMTPADRKRRELGEYAKAMDEIERVLKPKMEREGGALWKMMDSGARGKWDQVRQVVAAPVLVKDPQNRVVPFAIKTGFSEGMDIADYWVQMHGVRKGETGKVLSTQKPGSMTKNLVNTNMSQLITDQDDCGTDRGITLPVDDRNVLDRFLAKPVKLFRGEVLPKDTLLTPGVVSRMQSSKVQRVTVRSPLKCEHGEGVCPKCYGTMSNGRTPEPGLNIGVIASQAMGEPSTQMALNTFHLGGVATPGEARGNVAADKFARLEQLLNMPKKLPGSATLASRSGKVDSVKADPAGGWEVLVSGQRHFVPQDRGLLSSIRRGFKVRKGNPISAGPINPHELLAETNIDTVRNYLTDELYEAYKNEGPVKRKNIEVVVRGLTNITRVTDPGDDGDYVRGDLAPSTLVAARNRASSGAPVLHSPVIKGMADVPRGVSEDWLARMQHTKIKSTLIDAAGEGWSSDIHGFHPIPGIAHGVEFGKGGNFKY